MPSFPMNPESTSLSAVVLEMLRVEAGSIDGHLRGEREVCVQAVCVPV